MAAHKCKKMMETLEQQQTKSTPNNEPHAGETETTPAASEEDDTTEEHNIVCDLEKKEKSNSPLREVDVKDVAEQHHRHSPQENGRDTEESEVPADPQEAKQDASQMANSLNEAFELPAKSTVKEECTVGKKSAEGDDFKEKPSTSLDVAKSLIDIKVEQASPILAINVDDIAESGLSDKPRSPLVENQQNGDIEMDSPEMEMNAETSSPNELSLTDQIKVEDKSPLFSVTPDEEVFSPPVIKMLIENSPCDQNVEEISLPGRSLSQEEENFTPTMKVNEKTSNSPVSMQEEEILSSSSIALRISESIKKEGRDSEEYAEREGLSEKEDIQEEASSPVYKPDEVGSATIDSEVTPPAKGSLPVYKINDFSPASIPDDEESSQDFNAEIKIEEASPKVPKMERKFPMEIIKIESDSEDEDVEIESENVVDEIEGSGTPAGDIQMEPEVQQSHNSIKERQTMDTLLTPPLKVKINGTHIANDELHVDEEEQEQEDDHAQNALQQSVIASDDQEQQQQELQPEQHQQLTRRSTTSSSVSSTSQHLVIDQPETEQQNKHQQPQLEELVQDQEMLVALKRRRSCSNSDSDRDDKDNGNSNTKPTTKHRCLEEEQQQQQQQPQASSLLLQRLQAPAMNCNELAQQLNCFKCNLNNFENLQQLNAHYALCKQQPEEATAPAETSAAAASTAIAAETLFAGAATNLPGSVALPNPTSTPAPTVKKERFFRCARCSTVHQCWNFFLHMREVHQRYICLYCSHVFASVEKLSLHLENKHDMDQRHFASIEAWRTLQTQEDRARYLVCCNCQASFERGSHFDDHDCAELMQPCALCGQKGGHANGCRNGSSTNNASSSNRKKAAARRKRKTAKSKQLATQLDEPQKPNKQQQEQLPNWVEPEAQASQMPPLPAALPDQNSKFILLMSSLL